jgi:hypothetical protein
MGTLKITLFDYDPATGNAKPPITAELEYDENMTLDEQGFKKLAIFAGNDVAGGTLFVPLHMLTGVMSTIMEEDQKRSPGIIMPDKSIIKPH